jgi:hypothetical protein
MATKAKEFISFWMEVSIHPRAELGLPGSSQDPKDLVERLLAAARNEGLSADDIIREIGDPAEYIKTKLGKANFMESNRRKP